VLRIGTTQIIFSLRQLNLIGSVNAYFPAPGVRVTGLQALEKPLSLCVAVKKSDNLLEILSQ
jgi:hypothetical protein